MRHVTAIRNRIQFRGKSVKRTLSNPALSNPALSNPALPSSPWLPLSAGCHPSLNAIAPLLNPAMVTLTMVKLIMAVGAIAGVTLVGPRPALAQLRGDSGSAPAEFRGDLTVEINGFNNREGEVCLSLFNSSQGFPFDWQQAIDVECVAVSAPPLQVTFDDLTYGSYAIAAYHDKNMDQQLNQGLFGIPIEGFAFSNDAPAQTGPASFQDAVFILSQQNATIQVQMRYLGLGGH